MSNNKGLTFVRVPIGQHYFEEDKKVFWYDYPYGSSISVAQQGYGKSSGIKDIQMKLLIADPLRKLIVFDKENEWAYNLTKPNWDAENPSCVSDYHIIDNFSIKVSDLSMADWLYLDNSMTNEVLKTIGRVAYKGKDIHEDNPEIFYQMCTDLPTQKANKKTGQDPVGDWNNKYGQRLWLDEPINYEIKRSVVSKVLSIKGRFYGSKNSSKQYIEDWSAEVQKAKVIFIDMGVEGYKPDHFVGLVVGKILEWLSKALFKLRPRIVFEEADYLVGNPDFQPTYLSTVQILTYITKYRKRGVGLYFISQTFGQLHPVLLKTRTGLLLGSIEKSDNRELYEWWKKLEIKANLVTGRRPFYYMDRIQFINTPFFPDLPCCNVKTQGIRFDIRDKTKKLI